MKYFKSLMLFFLSVFSVIISASLEEKHIVVVVCSYNNSQWSRDTLDSIFTQEYSNFELIIVDDCSDDGNQEVIQSYIDEHGLAEKVTFIANNKRRRKLYNLYNVLYRCNDDDIVIMLDGDDKFAHSHVFSFYNDYFDDENVWFTYGQYRNDPAEQAVLWGFKEMGYCREVPKSIQRKRAYRQYSFIYMHPRAFRGWLFKLVKLEDLIADKVPGFEGDFYPAANDVAMYFPMVEMAHTHIRFIPEVLYIRNLHSDIVGFKVDRKIQLASSREVRKKDIYPILFKPQKNRLADLHYARVDMFLVCPYSLSGIETMINNVTKNVQALDTLYIFFPDTLENKALSRRLKHQYPDIAFFSYSISGAGKTLKNRLLTNLSHSSAEYVLVGTNNFEIEQEIDTSHLIYWLERTYAYRFYLNRYAEKKKVPRCIHLDEDVYAWKFISNKKGWLGIMNSDDIFLSRKMDLLQDLKLIDFDTGYNFMNEIHANSQACARVGLFFRWPKLQRLQNN